MDLQFLEENVKFSNQDIYVKKWLVKSPQGVPILLLHESLGSVKLWKDFPSKLALITQRHVIAYDRLGFGQSSKVDEPLALSFVSDEVEFIIPEILKQLDIQKFIVLGHSIGGGMSIVCGALNPQNCKAVITLSAQSIVEQLTLHGIHKAKVGFHNEKLFNRLARYHGDKTQWVLDAWTETWLSADFSTWNLDRYLHQIVCPLLVIHGEKDEYATLAQPRRLIDYALTPNKILKVLKDCGHFPHREKEQDVLQIIQTFLMDIV